MLEFASRNSLIFFTSFRRFTFRWWPQNHVTELPYHTTGPKCLKRTRRRKLPDLYDLAPCLNTCVSRMFLAAPGGPRNTCVLHVFLEAPGSPRNTCVLHVFLEAPGSPRNTCVSHVFQEAPGSPRNTCVSRVFLEAPGRP